MFVCTLDMQVVMPVSVVGNGGRGANSRIGRLGGGDLETRRCRGCVRLIKRLPREHSDHHGSQSTPTLQRQRNLKMFLHVCCRRN
jgi:hypothetical protein